MPRSLMRRKGYFLVLWMERTPNGDTSPWVNSNTPDDRWDFPSNGICISLRLVSLKFGSGQNKGHNSSLFYFLTKNTMTSKLRKHLSQYQGKSDLKGYVADYILGQYETDDEIETDMRGILRHGCVSGWVSSLIYYSDTHAFYDRYYDEIEDLRLEWEENL